MTFLLINIILLLLIIFLVVVLSMVWPPDSPWAPWWKTSRQTALAMGKLAKINKRDIVYELGSGDGTALITVVSDFGARGVGIEIDPLRFFIAQVKVYLRKIPRIKFVRKNFFDQDISGATVVFVYLVPKALARLMPKFKQELKKGTRIVSFRYKLPIKYTLYDKKNDLYLYILK